MKINGIEVTAKRFAYDDRRCHLRANTCASYGYLYVAAWIEGEQP